MRQRLPPRHAAEGGNDTRVHAKVDTYAGPDHMQVRTGRKAMDLANAATAGLVRWDQQQAKAKFSEVVRRARSEGPQLVTTRGAKPVVVLSADDYVSLVEQRPTSFRDLLLPGDELKPDRATVAAKYTPVSL
jgi:prevent-host-death family protein